MSIRRKTKTERILGIIQGALGNLDFELAGMEKAMLFKRRTSWMSQRPGALSKAIYDLARRGYLEEVEIDNKRYLKMTNKGRWKIWKPKIDKSKWDGKWRLVAFDIPEKRKKIRDSFRSALKVIGFKQMQKSLWICPYDVSEETEKVLEILDLHYEVDYFVAHAITNADRYLDYFKLNHK